MRLFEFYQNERESHFEEDPNYCEFIVIEAETAEEADSRIAAITENSEYKYSRNQANTPLNDYMRIWCWVDKPPPPDGGRRRVGYITMMRDDGTQHWATRGR